MPEDQRATPVQTGPLSLGISTVALEVWPELPFAVWRKLRGSFGYRAKHERVRLHAVDPALWGQGVGATLYRWFGERAMEKGCTRIRALAAPHREGSIAFHRALGFDGPLVADYLGAGEDRIVFERALPIP